MRATLYREKGCGATWDARTRERLPQKAATTTLSGLEWALALDEFFCARPGADGEAVIFIASTPTTVPTPYSGWRTFAAEHGSAGVRREAERPSWESERWRGAENAARRGHRVRGE